jgi:predicted permease
MFHVLGNIILPIFSIILLGYILRVKQVLQPSFAKPANQIVYYVAIPAMFLNTISKAPFRTDFNLVAVLCLLGSLILLTLVGLVSAKVLKVKAARRGTYLQSCFHGNIGYLSYAIAYYALGESHFAQTAILSSFLIVGQNIMAVWMLTLFSQRPECGRPRWILFKYIGQNPIIITVIVGVVWALLNLPVPHPVRQFLGMLSGMAFPTALLLIGASLSFGAFRSMGKEIASIGVLKLIVMPLSGFLLMLAAQVPRELIVPGLILLATPPATVTYVMATELGGDPELAATSVSILTLVSAITYSLLLSVLMA